MRMKARRGLFYRWNPADKAILKQHLGPQGRLLLIVHTLFLLAEALSGAFVNVFLWKKAGDYALIALYNIAFFVAVQFAFMFSGKWVKVYNKMSCLKAGIAIAAAFYLFVLFLGDNAVRYIVPLGLLQGVGHGFFWLSFNIVLFEITSRENRDKFNGLAGVFGSFVGMAAPLIAGYFISVMTGATGYYMIFALSLAVYIAAAIFSVFFNRRKSGGQFSIRETRLIFQRDKTWRFIFLAMIGQGFNESVFHFLIGILVFVATNNEWKVGVYTAITSGVAFFSFYVAGKFLRPE